MTHLLLGAGPGAAGGGGPSFSSPLDLSGLVGWWAPRFFSSLNLTGSAVNSIADQSGLGNTLSWGANAKPVYSATSFNTSYPGITNDGHTAGSELSMASFPMGTGNTLTAWFVGTNTGFTGLGSNAGRLISYAAPTTGDFNSVGSWVLARSGTSNTAIQISRNGTGGTVSATITSPRRIILTISSSGVQTVYVDGVATTVGTLGGNWISAGTLRIGGGSSSLAWWDGPWADAGVATADNTALVPSLDTYLKTATGL